MSIEDYWADYAREEYESQLIEHGISDRTNEQISNYLGIYGDAIQERIDRCLNDAKVQLKNGFPSSAIVSAVTASELSIHFFILRPVLEGAFLSEEWSEILMNRILNQRAASDRKLLPAVLHQWKINLAALKLSNDEQLWNLFVTAILPLRNDIVHQGANASNEQAEQSIRFAYTFLEKVVAPLSDRFGFSWSKTRKWSSIQQGIGGATSSRHYQTKSPFKT